MWMAPYSPTWAHGAHAPRCPGDTAAGLLSLQSEICASTPRKQNLLSHMFPCLCSLSQHPLTHMD